ncbi:hypothetical protein CHS0354_008871 [Potamilus streckersoni]|uniref:Lipoxygenase n=1 Tax=Potamilus streckersoni TaxID=2493646 RepID=A0AAE0RU92_9BIVA|nr:hypothetical protein CHS0354_008871 [Potamilus streckersoni]
MSNDVPIPAYDIFQPNSSKEIRIRFFNHTVRDNAATDLRCAFLKFGDNESEGPMDMAFTTGDVSLFNDSESLQDFLAALDGGPWALKLWAYMNPMNYHALVESLRRPPRSWTYLDYCNHVTYSCITGENTRRLFRFRLVGTGILDEFKLSPEEQKEPWTLKRPEAEVKKCDYYLGEALENVAVTNPTMRLQIQHRDVTSDIVPEELKDPCKSWDEKSCPWEDIADIVLTYKVPNVLAERAKFNVEKIPDGISVQTLANASPYTYLLNVHEKVLFASTRSRPLSNSSFSDVICKPEMTTYLVHVETGYQIESETNAAVSISIYGTKGRTRKLLLDKSFHNDFERGRKDAYYLQAPVVGDIKFVKIFLVGGGRSRDWFLRDIVIFDLNSRKSYDFPCFQWITANITIPKGNAILIQREEDPALWHIRKLEIAQKQKTIGWHTENGFTGRIDFASYKDLPRDLKFAIDQEWERGTIFESFATKMKLHHFTSIFNAFDSFEDFRAMAEILEQSEIAKAILNKDNWMRDEEFGRMVLDGINPIMLRRCEAPLENFPVTDEILKGCLDRELNLQEEMEAGHVYILDYKILEGIPRTEGSYLPNPLCLMYVRTDEELVPIAIQLEQKPSLDNPIWTPNDTELDWLFAKTWVKSADANMHAIYTHLFRAHYLSETFAVSTHRNLPVTHPVYKLLMPHVKYTIAVNTASKNKLVGGDDTILAKLLALGGKCFDLIARAYSEFKWDHLNVPMELSIRGVDDPQLLPNYHYRDDAMKMWKCISDFMSKVVHIYYKTDSDIEEDEELQNWMKDIKLNGLVSWKEEDNGVPGCVESVLHLIEIMTMIIYNESCFHAAVNFGQVDYYQFGPNYPGAMRAPPPTKKKVTTISSIMAALPTKSGQSMMIAFTSFLSKYSSLEAYLGEYHDPYFTEPSVREVQAEFRDNLKKISEEIQTRNKSLKIPYTYLLPERVPNSTSV